MSQNQFVDQDQITRTAKELAPDKVLNQNTLTAFINHLNEYTLQLLLNTILLTSHRGTKQITKEDLDLAIDYMM